MDLMEAIRARHSVRSYTQQKIEGEVLTALKDVIAGCNRDSGLNIQLCLDEPAAFSGLMPRYGKFSGVRNYIALVGKGDDSLERSCGYYGEKIVLEAQRLGLSTCWVAATFSKGKAKKAVNINPGEKLLMVISIGYSTTAGVPHKSKPIAELFHAPEPVPHWFMSGVEAAMLAPTATNQQKFLFTLEGDTVKLTSGSGFYTQTDLGIVKYHFEVGSGRTVDSL